MIDGVMARDDVMKPYSLTVRSTPLGRMMCKVTGRERLNCCHRPLGSALLGAPLLALSPTSTSVRNFDWINVGTLATDMLNRRDMRRPRLRGASVTMALNMWYSFILIRFLQLGPFSVYHVHNSLFVMGITRKYVSSKYMYYHWYYFDCSTRQ